MDLLSRKTPFASVKEDLSAVRFHKNRYENGSVDALARQCFQYWQQLKNHHSYKKLIEEMEGK